MNVIINDTVVINNKSIRIKPINFEAICDLEDLGLDLKAVGKKTFSAFRCVLAYNADISLSEASSEIESHIKNGGKINDLFPLVEAVTSSDFFNSLVKSAESQE